MVEAPPEVSACPSTIAQGDMCERKANRFWINNPIKNLFDSHCLEHHLKIVHHHHLHPLPIKIVYQIVFLYLPLIIRV